MSVLLVSTRTGAGKTTVGLGLAKIWQEEGEEVGYLKPWADRLGNQESVVYDKDAKTFKQSLNLSENLDKLSILPDYETFIENPPVEEKETKESLKERYKKVSEENDVTILEGPRNFSFGAYMGLSSADIADELDSKAIIVANGDLGVIMDKTLTCKRIFDNLGVEVIGTVLNSVEDRKKTKDLAGPALEEKGLRILGVLPHRKEISYLTPRRIADEIGAKVLAGKAGLDKEVGYTAVGALTVSRALGPLRKRKNIALITGGDRTDMQLASFEVSTSCLVLTGGIFPDQTVLSKADRYDIPVLLVSEFTYGTAKKVEHITATVGPEEKKKIDSIKETVREFLPAEEIKRLQSGA